METAAERPALRVALITGLSGAGKTAALKALEDVGYFSIDNLPCSLVDPLFVLFEENAGITKVAMVMDERDPAFVQEAGRVLALLRSRGHHVFLLFLTARDDVLIRRFGETRRPHPMSKGRGVADGVRRERELFAPLEAAASFVLDTSDFNIHQLRAAAIATIEKDPGTALSLLVLSFGFKYGIPLEASFVFDVRFLPNPFFVPELRDKDGTDPAVAAYVLSDAAGAVLVDEIARLAEGAAPLCDKEGRSALVLAVGCTGGQHRSVAVAEILGRRLTQKGYFPAVIHRDMGRAR